MVVILGDREEDRQTLLLWCRLLEVLPEYGRKNFVRTVIKKHQTDQEKR